MTYDLAVGDRAYSSWSLRGWLLFDAWNLPVRLHLVEFAGDGVEAQLAALAPARTVPTLRTPEGAIVSESLAIAEELATRFPMAGLWPEDALARATARSLAAEMHAGFAALRNGCPMNLRVSYADFRPDEAIMADLARLERIWTHARAVCGGSGPWLCGTYSVADAFFAPVAARIAGYGLPVSEPSQGYVRAHLAHPSFRRWRAMALAHGPHLPWYARDYAQRPWPGPKPIPARAVESGPSVNDACPYSGKPVSHFLEAGGKVFGFCNAFCRDKTVADPKAWPAFLAVYES
ncbi:MAG: glutathione S-transferase [Paracoccaceae bacterium]|nr:glutathione S-transferase [Paracoccaceae bacterium]